ncbi:hypothetical protein AHiyo8_27170 [Arthrobacter sp. Hiyo8]|nr:hypothetical protein AHiyo8_27170 [Arthrobacter sp. Hiyo8]
MTSTITPASTGPAAGNADAGPAVGIADAPRHSAGPSTQDATPRWTRYAFGRQPRWVRPSAAGSS